jgi:hypothetical protein
MDEVGFYLENNIPQVFYEGPMLFIRSKIKARVQYVCETLRYQTLERG